MLVLKNINFEKNDKTILKNINLQIKEQSLVAITGPNGSRKIYIS